ncbi:MAG: M48 family metalloprotease [Candidatus Micrarchaeota archaeon]
MLYQQIESNRRKSFLLIVVFILVILALGYVFGELFALGYFGLLLALVLASVSALGGYYYSDSIVLKISNARPAQKEEFPHLINTIEGLSIAAGFRTPPRAYVIDDPAPNAFATGRDPDHSALAVTTGLLQKLSRYELEGVLGHEMSHIKNYDTRLATLAVVLVGVAALLSNWILRGSYLRGRGGSAGRRGGGALVILFVVGIFFAILAPFLTQLLRLALSRQREYLADADGALLTRHPEGLASALEKIAKDANQLHSANDATATLFIVNPFKRGINLRGLLATHPPTEERIRRLRAM